MTHPPGTIFVLRSGGWTSALIRWGTQSRVNHAGIALGNGATIEGEPSGAKMRLEQDGPRVIYGDTLIASIESIRPGVGTVIAAQAVKLRYAPYSWLTIANDAFQAFGRRQHWLDRIIDRRHEWVCSALCDQAYLAAGVHLFTDGRQPGRVDPGDLLMVIASGGQGVVVDPA